MSLGYLHHHGYTGSNSLTYGDMLNWAKTSDDAWDHVCQGVFGLSTSQCAANPFSGNKNIYDDHGAGYALLGVVLGIGAVGCALTWEVCAPSVLAGGTAIGNGLISFYGHGGGVPEGDIAGSAAAGTEAGAGAGSIRYVNPSGGDQNCVSCVVATDATLAGHPASALPGGPFDVWQLEKMYGQQFYTVSGEREITRRLQIRGDGAHGIVWGMRGSSMGHVWNAVNQGGVVRFLDGQTGKEASFDGYSGFAFMWTNKP